MPASSFLSRVLELIGCPTDVREEAGRRVLVLVNPWRSTEPAETTEPDSWTAGLRRALLDSDGASRPPMNASHALTQLLAGPATLVVDWDALSAHFASLHVNWDPSAFAASCTAHVCVPQHFLPAFADLASIAPLRLRPLLQRRRDQVRDEETLRLLRD